MNPSMFPLKREESAGCATWPVRGNVRRLWIHTLVCYLFYFLNVVLRSCFGLQVDVDAGL